MYLSDTLDQSSADTLLARDTGRRSGNVSPAILAECVPPEPFRRIESNSVKGRGEQRTGAESVSCQFFSKRQAPGRLSGFYPLGKGQRRDSASGCAQTNIQLSESQARLGRQ